MSDHGTPYQGDYDIDDYDDDFEDDDDSDCMLMEDGQCLKAGSEECDFCCPNRMSEFFAGSPAWRKKHGSMCACGAEIEDGEEPGHPRQCPKCSQTEVKT